MQTDYKIRGYYDKYAKRDSNAKSHSNNSNWGYCFFLAGVGLGILFFPFILKYGFNNVLFSSIGIVSLLFVIIGLIILINSD